MEKCCVHNDVVAELRDKLYPDVSIEDVADLFKTLSDPGRVKILAALRFKELCVGDIALLLEASQSAVSHQLRLLRKSRLVRARRDKKMVYYSLDDKHISTLIDTAMEHVDEAYGMERRDYD